MNPNLIILPYNPGDVLLGLQLALAVSRADPQRELYFLTGQEAHNLPKLFPCINKTWILPQSTLKAFDRSGKTTEGFNFLEEWLKSLSSQTFHLTVNLYQDIWGGILHSYIPSQIRVGLDFVCNSTPSIRGRALEHCLAIPTNRAQNPFHVLDLWAMSVNVQEFIHPAPLKNTYARTAQPIREKWNLKLPKENYFAIQPGAAWPGKMWPASYWAELCNMLINDNKTLVCLGAPEEIEKCQALEKLLSPQDSDKFINVCGRTQLHEIPALLSQVSQLITGDTYAMHAAALVGTPCVCLFGPSNPIETGPYGPGHIIIQTHLRYPEKLAFETPDPRWIHLAPSALYQLIKAGKPPNGFSVWYTSRHPTLNSQILLSAQGELHPFQVQYNLWNNILTTPELLNQIELPEELKDIYTECLINTESSKLSRLLEAEKSIGVKMSKNLLWEACVLGISSLPLHPLGNHILLRKKRTERFFQEYHYSSTPHLTLAGTNS